MCLTIRFRQTTLKALKHGFKEKSPNFFLISIDNETYYASTEYLSLKKPQNLLLYNQKISVYLTALNFSDRTAKIFIYNNYQDKYLKTLLICDALFTLITAIVILFFIFRHILTQIYGTLNVVEQSETELINEKKYADTKHGTRYPHSSRRAAVIR